MIPDRLTPADGELRANQKRLHGAWNSYIRNVSMSSYAISLESCSYILWLAEHLPAKTAIDFGSGLTSYVLRLAVDGPVSVDDDAGWLEKTRGFLRLYRESTDGLFMFDGDWPRAEYDLVVYDLAGGDIRNENMSMAVGLIAADGVGILDDAHFGEHLEAMEAACEEHGRELHLLQSWTTDQIGRFSALVC